MEAEQMKQCDTDHAIVHLNLLAALLEERQKLPPISKWKLEKLNEAEHAEAYKQAVRDGYQRPLNFFTPTRAPDTPDDQKVQALADKTTKIINMATANTIGRRTVVPHIQTPWLTGEARAAAKMQMKRRLAALKEYDKANSKPDKYRNIQHIMALRERYEDCKMQAQIAVKTAKRVHSKQIARLTNEACKSNINTKYATHMLNKAGCISKSMPDITELEMPGTDETYTNTTDKAECLIGNKETTNRCQATRTHSMGLLTEYVSYKVQPRLGRKT
jgi:hypothetical protein